MSEELRFRRRSSVAEAVCYLLLLAVSLAVFGSIARMDFLGLVNEFFRSSAGALQELLGIF